MTKKKKWRNPTRWEARRGSEKILEEMKSVGCRFSFGMEKGERCQKWVTHNLRDEATTPRPRPYTLKRRKINIVCSPTSTTNERKKKRPPLEREKINTLAHHRTCRTDISSTPLLGLSTIGMQLRITYGFVALEFRAAAASARSTGILAEKEQQQQLALGGYTSSHTAEEHRRR